jgi:integrase
MEEVYGMAKRNIGANKVEPIRDLEKIERMNDYLNKQSPRNRFLFLLGINSGLKITDILPLTVEEVKYASYLIIHEKKGNIRRIKMTASLKEEIEEYLLSDMEEYPSPAEGIGLENRQGGCDFLVVTPL